MMLTSNGTYPSSVPIVPWGLSFSWLPAPSAPPAPWTAPPRRWQRRGVTWKKRTDGPVKGGRLEVPFGGNYGIFSKPTFQVHKPPPKIPKPTFLKNISWNDTWIMWVIITSGVELDSDIPPHLKKLYRLYLHPRIPSPASKTKATLQHDSSRLLKIGPWKEKNIEFSNQHCSSFCISIYRFPVFCLFSCLKTNISLEESWLDDHPFLLKCSLFTVDIFGICRWGRNLGSVTHPRMSMEVIVSISWFITYIYCTYNLLIQGL